MQEFLGLGVLALVRHHVAEKGQGGADREVVGVEVLLSDGENLADEFHARAMDLGGHGMALSREEFE
jgi:hypothetical protein